MASIMVESNSSINNTDNTNIHPFFSVPKQAAKDSVSTTVTAGIPITPDSSCSPKSTHNESDATSTETGRKRKRQQAGDASKPQEEQGTTNSYVNSTDPAPKPQKLLKLNLTTGTIGPPPKTDSRATKRKTTKGAKSKTLLVSVKYGNGDDASRLQIGEKIDKILTVAPIPIRKNTVKTLPNTPPSSRETDDELQQDDVPKKRTPKKKKAAASGVRRQQTLEKTTHPFFQGRAKTSVTIEEREKPPARVFFTSNSSSRQPVTTKFNIPSISVDSKVLKVPGAKHPAWPWEGIVHVRGDVPSLTLPSETTQFQSLGKKRKSKGQQVQVAKSESIIRQAALDLNLEQIVEQLKASNDDQFQPLPSTLRTPSRHFESGKKLQERIISELKTFRRNGDNSKTHAAITHTYNSIQGGTSAFDRCTCETTAWAQKYAPSTAERVLQSGPEAELLRDWLIKLKVQAVDTGAAESATKSKGAAPSKNKGKRKKKLDGFIVTSDDEADELNEVDVTDESESLGGFQGNVKKTVVRSSRRSSRENNRLANSVVLSGPHGCGKTATVYAVAKELDFEVFEINPGSRRNGKDVLEKVGDMTRNHLVQQHKEDMPRDASGKQGMMAAFFKPKATTAPEPTTKLAEPPNTKDVKKATKAQKQSLILLEEVDVLYEEDKQFWATVISMISQSKRPFIMTCNDEALLPLQSFNLHGIFRLSTPPRDLAVDLLILVAANEGHALRRQAVEALYDSRCQDLRASITELNYWCQIGVGDAQGGFNWFYPRWPKGSDIDEEGRAIRVVSQDTYQFGMGWLSRDTATSNSSFQSAQEELHQQIGENWFFDAYDTLTSSELTSWASTATERCSTTKQRLELLESLDSFSSLMSDTDLGCVSFSTPPNQFAMDASMPELPAKVREDFIAGRQLLEVSPLVQYDTTCLDMFSSLKSLGRSHFKSRQSNNMATSTLEPLNETKAIATLQGHFGESLPATSAITRFDYSIAFDPIAASEKIMTGSYLDPSVFDGTMKSITVDIAPYVRSIVSYDQRLQQERLLRSSLVSEGGQPGKKRMRTTRSALSALEGNTRASTRRERYFAADVNSHLVMRTGGKGWDAIATAATGNNTEYPRGQSEEADIKLVRI